MLDTDFGGADKPHGNARWPARWTMRRRSGAVEQLRRKKLRRLVRLIYREIVRQMRGDG
jgi:hypothetical protein